MLFGTKLINDLNQLEDSCQWNWSDSVHLFGFTLQVRWMDLLLIPATCFYRTCDILYQACSWNLDLLIYLLNLTFVNCPSTEREEATFITTNSIWVFRATTFPTCTVPLHRHRVFKLSLQLVRRIDNYCDVRDYRHTLPKLDLVIHQLHSYSNFDIPAIYVNRHLM